MSLDAASDTTTPPVATAAFASYDDEWASLLQQASALEPGLPDMQRFHALARSTRSLLNPRLGFMVDDVLEMVRRLIRVPHIVCVGRRPQKFTLLRALTDIGPSAAGWRSCATMGPDVEHDRMIVRESFDPERVFHCGGCEYLTTRDSCRSFSFSLNKWQPQPSMISARSGHGLARVGGSATMVFGGWSESGQMDSVEILRDGTPDEWRSVAKLPFARHYGGCCTLGTDGETAAKVLLAGGMQRE